MIVGIYDDVVEDVGSYRSSILKAGFEDVLIGNDLFKNVRGRGVDALALFLLTEYPDYSPTLNFVRRSPLNQKEPNYIHTDEMMGDLTAILYLNENPPKADGTTLYYKGAKSCILKARCNRLVVFPSYLHHSRNIYANYGYAEDARLIQVCFLKKTVTEMCSCE